MSEPIWVLDETFVVLPFPRPPASFTPQPHNVPFGFIANTWLDPGENTGYAITVEEFVAEQPLVVPVTVYVVVVVGDAVTEDPVVELKPVDGLHEYVEAPDAVNVVELPAQIVALPTVNVTVGVVLNVITTSSVDGVQGLFEIVHLNV